MRDDSGLNQGGGATGGGFSMYFCVLGRELTGRVDGFDVREMKRKI